jgi:hypothetical protein
MSSTVRIGYVAECFWSGVSEEDLHQLDSRIEAAVAELAGRDDRIAYLGSMLILDDEVVLCLFEGPIATVQLVTARSGIQFGRILAATGAPWSRGSSRAEA